MAPLKSAPLDRNVQVRFTADDHDELKQLAAAAGMRPSELIRLMVHSTLLRKPSPEELAELAQDAAEGHL